MGRGSRRASQRMRESLGTSSVVGRPSRLGETMVIRTKGFHP